MCVQCVRLTGNWLSEGQEGSVGNYYEPTVPALSQQMMVISLWVRRGEIVAKHMG